MRILLIVIGIVSVFCLLHLTFRTDSLRQPTIISHRGAGGLAPENTLVGIQAALDHQMRLVEVDLRRSQDGVLLLLHDRTVDRTTDGQGAVHALPWSTLQMLDAGGHLADEFAGTPIPTLDAVFAFIKDKPVTLVIEFKDTVLYPGIEQALADAIKQHHLEKQMIVISFQPTSLQTFHQIMPQVAQGMLTLYPTNLAFTKHGQAGKARLVSIYWPSVILDPTLVYRLHKHDYTVWVWTVNQPWLMRLLRWIGVDGITTDRPDLAAAVVSER